MENGSNVGEGHENYTNQLKSNKVKAGACYVLPDRTWLTSEMQEDHEEPPDKENSCKDSLIATHPYLIFYSYHKGRTDYKIYLVKVKVNPNGLCFHILFSHTITFLKKLQTDISLTSRGWGLFLLSWGESATLSMEWLFLLVLSAW